MPGEIRPTDGEIILNEGRETREVTVENTGDRPIQVGSHFHFFETNKYLRFDRESTFGMRLNIPAGRATRFEPGEQKDVELVDLAGKRRVIGLNNLTNGSLNSNEVKEAALRRAKSQGYKGV